MATIAFFHLSVQIWVRELTLPAEIEQVVLKELIPALYLQLTGEETAGAPCGKAVKNRTQSRLKRGCGRNDERSPKSIARLAQNL